MTQNGRMLARQAAKEELLEFLLSWQKRRDLTYLEYLNILAGIVHEQINARLRVEDRLLSGSKAYEAKDS